MTITPPVGVLISEVIMETSRMSGTSSPAYNTYHAEEPVGHGQSRSQILKWLVYRVRYLPLASGRAMVACDLVPRGRQSCVLYTPSGYCSVLEYVYKYSYVRAGHRRGTSSIRYDT